jgi:hypothetical protein
LGTIISTEPCKVNAKMWQHVSSRGTCTNPHAGVSILLNNHDQFHCLGVSIL